MAVYRLLGQEIPASLYEPISKEELPREAETPVHTMTPTLDGKLTHYFEWASAGVFLPASEGAAMHRASGHIDHIYLGVDNENLYLRFDTKGPFKDFLDRCCEVRVVQVAPLPGEIILCKQGKDYELKFLREGRERATRKWKSVAVGDIAELSLPWPVLGCGPGDECRLRFRVLQRGMELESYPVARTLVVPCPSEDFDARAWIV